MTDYFLRTERLGFRRWRAEDFELALALWSDPDVTKYFGGPFSATWVRERIAREIVTMTSLGVQYWPLFLLETNEHIGVCGLRPHDEAARVFALGFHLHKQHWGHGYAKEAARAVIDYAFEHAGATALFAGHHPQNARSRRTLEALGFRYTHDQLYPPTGLQHLSYRLERP